MKERFEEPKVVIYNDMTVNEAKKMGCSVIAKGIRGLDDFNNEMQQAHINNAMSDIQTILIPTDPRYSMVSSTIVKHLFKIGGNWSSYVPPIVTEAMIASRK